MGHRRLLSQPRRCGNAFLELQDLDSTSVSRYVVTGCAGFVGSHLAERLLEQGHEVVGIDAFTDYYHRALKESNLERCRTRAGFELLEADLTSAPLPGPLEGAAGIFHLAAQPGVRGSFGQTFSTYVRDNVIASQRLFEAAASASVRVVYASSSSIYGNAETYPTCEDVRPRPISPYGVTKLSCEHLAGAYELSSGLDAVGLRYFTVYGPRQRPDMAFSRLLAALLGAKPFGVNGTGEQSRDFTYVSDSVAATMAAMERGRPGVVYNIGGGAETTLNAVIEIAEELSGRRLQVRHDPAAAGDVRRTAADTSLIRRDTGWRPVTALAEGLSMQLEEALRAQRAGEHASVPSVHRTRDAARSSERASS
jgi:nucleoside-diphosphate-sugar epimerase